MGDLGKRADGRLRAPAAKKALLKMVAEGAAIKDAVNELGFAYATYEYWRKRDPEWAESLSRTTRVASIMGKQAAIRATTEMDFPAFSEKYLGAKVFPHMQNVVDMLGGVEPSWVHPAMTYLKGDQRLVVVNMPPEHGKTMTLTINYPTYITCMNPNIMGLIVSKTRDMSMKMLYAIKSRLTENMYADLIEDYAPPGGFKGGGGKWTQDTIYLNPEVRTSGEKDPSWQALGIGSQIYGARADIIILDDCVDSTNAHEYGKHIEWIQSHVLSRLAPDGVLIIVGTRLAPMDLYMAIQDPQLYPDEVSPWTYLAMPAVLEYDDDAENWITLWPKTNMPNRGLDKELPDEDGLYEKWSGPRLRTKRSRMQASLWARVYQQQQVAEDTVFDPEDVRGCVNGRRNFGLIPANRAGVRTAGMSGITVVAGLDPATSGFTAMAVVGLDIMDKKRYLLDVFNRANCAPDDIRNNIYRLTEKYGIVEWVVETNGFQGFLAHDREINQFLSSRGAMVRPHHTGNIKHDPDFGVSAMAGLFKGWRDGHNLIEFPSTYASEGIKALVEQLGVWVPKSKNKHQKTDAVMAFWMAELACMRRIEMASSYTRSHRPSQFHTSYDRQRQFTVDLTNLETYDKLVGA